MNKILPVILLCLTISMIQAQLSDEILLNGYTHTPEPNVHRYTQDNTQNNIQAIQGRYYRLLQFNTLPTASEHSQLKALDIRLLKYIPNKAYLASLPSSLNAGDLLRVDLRHISEIDRRIRISSDILADEIPKWARPSSGELELMLTHPSDLSQEYVLASLEKEGIIPTEHNGINPSILIRLSEDKLPLLMEQPYVLRLEAGPAPSRPDDRGGKNLARANLLDSKLPGGRQYNGKGISVLTRDDGDVGPHIDFTGRLNQDFTSNPNSTHADLVSGVMCGAANLNPEIEGMATAAELYVIRYDETFLDTTMRLHLDENVLVTNSSYSNGCNRGYTEITQTVDDQCYENPTLMHVFSSGNDNGESCGYGAGDQWGNITGGHKQGKNVITVGSTNSLGRIADSSSRGPAYDGRIKPDLTGHGQSHTSTLPNNAYRTTSGTSFSAPQIAGVMAMLHQAYRDNNDQETADAALLKTIMLNTANDFGNPGPDFIFGWGSINGYKAALTIEEKRYQTGSIGLGETKSHQIDVPSGVTQAKIMVYWKDPSAVPDATTALINDLDTWVESPDGTETLPLVLNPEPNPQVLNAPARQGIDRLNNMEQVVIDNPAAGLYELFIAGSVIPFGVHDYTITWEYITDDIMLTYPVGGEQLEPGETFYAHWDAQDNGEPFDIELSVDGMQTWTEVSTDVNFNLVQVGLPVLVTDAAHLRVTRGNQEVISEAFTLAAAPLNITVDRVCFDFVDLNWVPVEGVESYDIYKLGEKYMEYLTTTTDTFATLTIENSFDEHWFAVSSTYPGAIRSQRSIAVGSRGEGLVNCKMEKDLLSRNLQLINDGNFITCEGPINDNPSFRIANDGLNSISGFDISYQINGGAIVTENYAETIEPDSSIVYTFSMPYNISNTGMFDIKVWTSRDGELLTQNDTLSFQTEVYFESGAPLPFTENFNRQDLPPFWRVLSPDPENSWGITDALQINGRRDGVCLLAFDSFGNQNSRTDALYSIPLDLSAASGKVALSFDLCYLHNNGDDGFRVEVDGACGQGTGEVLFEKFGRDLNTASTYTDRPEEVSDWTNVQLDLSDYVGAGKVMIRFIGINDNGSNLYIDNINVSEQVLSEPIADFSIEGDGSCEFEKIILTDLSTGGLLDHEWNFGLGSVPNDSEYSGPHDLIYVLSGEPTITLTVTNELGTNTVTKPIKIETPPSGGWQSEEIDLGQVQFTNSFQNVTEFIWDFGDGQTSDEPEPLHQYSEPGAYQVSLQVRNRCGQQILTSEIIVISSSVYEVKASLGLQVIPNPNNGNFRLSLNTNAQNVEIDILSTNGEKLKSQTITVPELEQSIYLAGLDAGMYLLRARTKNAQETVKFVIE